MILAVDPGLSGALCLYDGKSLIVRDMPTLITLGGKRIIAERRLFDGIRSTRSSFAQWGAGPATEWLVIEKVGGLPRQSASAAFNFGRGVGVIIGAAMAAGLQIEEVHPSTWKSALRVPADKKMAVVRANELLPAYAHLWAIERGSCNQEQASGRAEAAMLAYYGFKMKGAL